MTMSVEWVQTCVPRYALTHQVPMSVAVTWVTLWILMDTHATVAIHKQHYDFNGDDANLFLVDECAISTDRCDHICHDTPDSYNCSCRSGFTLDDDGVSCTGKYYTIRTCEFSELSVFIHSVPKLGTEHAQCHAKSL